MGSALTEGWSRSHLSQIRTTYRRSRSGIRVSNVDWCFVGSEGTQRALQLTLVVNEPEVILELEKHPVGAERNDYAGRALKMGALCLRDAGGSIDAEAIKKEGDRLVGSVRELLVNATLRDRRFRRARSRRSVVRPRDRHSRRNDSDSMRSGESAPRKTRGVAAVDFRSRDGTVRRPPALRTGHAHERARWSAGETNP